MILGVILWFQLVQVICANSLVGSTSWGFVLQHIRRYVDFGWMELSEDVNTHFKIHSNNNGLYIKC